MQHLTPIGSASLYLYLQESIIQEAPSRSDSATKSQSQQESSRSLTTHSPSLSFMISQGQKSAAETSQGGLTRPRRNSTRRRRSRGGGGAESADGCPPAMPMARG